MKKGGEKGCEKRVTISCVCLERRRKAYRTVSTKRVNFDKDAQCGLYFGALEIWGPIAGHLLCAWWMHKIWGFLASLRVPFGDL